jgi:hypothetical protein
MNCARYAIGGQNNKKCKTTSIRGKYVLSAFAGAKSAVPAASAFPQNPSGNPTLTAVALNYHSVNAVIDRYVKNPGALFEVLPAVLELSHPHGQ